MGGMDDISRKRQAEIDGRSAIDMKERLLDLQFFFICLISAPLNRVTRSHGGKEMLLLLLLSKARTE